MANNELNVFSAGRQDKALSVESAAQAMATTRQAQEVQAAMVVAKRFPRNEEQSMDRILTACTRQTLAESAIYSYPRGGQEITGPSIRLAECIAQNWGNIDFGYIELEQRNGESQVMAYAWDLETNTRQSKVFSVPHRRDTNKGSYALTDARDIYEVVANQASRRVRSCILAVIPGDVVDSALKQCEATLKGASANGKKPLDELITDMVLAFDRCGVTEEMLSAYIGKSIEAFNEKDVLKLRKVYTSLKDGIVGNDYFLQRMKDAVKPAAQEEPAPEEQKAKPKAKAKAAAAQKQPEPETDEEEAVDLDDLF